MQRGVPVAILEFEGTTALDEFPHGGSVPVLSRDHQRRFEAVHNLGLISLAFHFSAVWCFEAGDIGGMARN